MESEGISVLTSSESYEEDSLKILVTPLFIWFYLSICVSMYLACALLAHTHVHMHAYTCLLIWMCTTCAQGLERPERYPTEVLGVELWSSAKELG